MVSPNVTFRATGDLGPALEARGDSLSAVALRDLQRYYDSLETALREIRLNESEWQCLRDILNGTICDERTAQLLWAEVDDADQGRVDAWGIDRADFVGRLRSFPVFSRMAICDAVERWWRENG